MSGKIPATCGNCGKAHLTTGKQLRGSKSGKVFCSRACQHQSRRFPDPVCRVCKKTYRRHNGKNYYCSIACRSKAMSGKNHCRWQKRVVVKCGWCGGKLLVPEGKAVRGPNLHCSRECADRSHSHNMRGAGNSNYLHGQSHKPYSLEFARVRQKIRRRERWKCFLCRKTTAAEGKRLCVHHIDYDKANNSKGNLVALCRVCHGAMHTKSVRRRTASANGLFERLTARYGLPPRSITCKWLKTAIILRKASSSTTAWWWTTRSTPRWPRPTWT